MNSHMTREQRRKLLLAEGTLQRFECVQARRAIGEDLGNIMHSGPAGVVLRAVSGRGLLSLAATALPLVLGAGRVARLLKRGILVAGGVAAAWSALSRLREQAAQEAAQDAAQEGAPADESVAAESASREGQATAAASAASAASTTPAATASTEDGGEGTAR